MAANLQSLSTDDATYMGQQSAGWNQPCTERHLAVISNAIADWRAVSPHLGLTEAEETAILGSNPHSVPAQRIAMLRKWKQKRGTKATYKRLCRAFDSCERADLVDKVKQLLAENNSSSDEEGEPFQSGDGLPPDQKKREQNPCAEFVTSLRQMYRIVQPPTWDPLPQCQHVKLAMIKEKGKRYECDTETDAESRVKGDVEQALTVKVPVDSDKIFDAGTFEVDRQVILVEGVGGMGKTSLAYQYAQKWAEGKYNMFDAVALVRLRDLNEHDLFEVDHILPHLFFLASDNKTKSEMVRCLLDKQNVLLILDGWDESPASIRKPSFLKDLLRSPQTRILITSRPDFSLDLHSLANRVEILGFTKNNIRDYFKTALKSQLSDDSEVNSACDKLSSHFHRYPVIESCCYVPLNCAILAYIYLNRNQTLPVTQCELFQELILCCIVRELQTRQPDRVLEYFSSFKDLPADLKEQLHNLSELAFKGVMQNKIVFTQKELKSLSTLGLLHSVQGFGSIGRKLFTCNFIHLAVQELLAAYYISQLELAEHSKQFGILLKDNHKFPVLQFYSGLTKLTNEGVQNLITGFDFYHTRHLLAILSCIFEAQITDQTFYEQVVRVIGLTLDFGITYLSPFDCLSVHYFLSSIRTVARGMIRLRLDSCRLDDDSFGLLLGISHEHTETSTSSVLESIETLLVLNNIFTDTGIAYFTRAINFTSISTLKTLKIGSDTVTDIGLMPLLEKLPKQQSLEHLELWWSSPHNDQSLEKIGVYAKRSKLKKLFLFPDTSCKQFKTEEEKQWVQSLMVGGNSLISSLECCQVHYLLMNIHFYTNSSYYYSKEVQLVSSLHETATKVNFEREKKALPSFGFDPKVLHLVISESQEF